jgi:uncharacterized cupin superfamily protein
MSKIKLQDITPRRGSAYPEPFCRMAANRLVYALGRAAKLTEFGVNLVRLPAGEWSSQRHWHSHEDEFVYVLEGTATLVTDAGEELLDAGESAGFRKGDPDGHHLVNKSDRDVVYLVVGTNHVEDVCEYSDIDMRVASADRRYVHKDGRPY